MIIKAGVPTVGTIFLLKLVQQKKPLSVVTELGIIPDKAFLPDEMALYTFLREYKRRHGAMPTYPMVVNQHAFQKYAGIKHTSDPLESFAEMVINRHILKTAHSLHTELEDALKTRDPQSVASLIQDSGKSIGKIATGSQGITRDVIMPLHKAMGLAVQMHDVRRDNVGIQGMSVGLPYIDHVTDGIYKGDFAALAARPGKGKTYFMLNACLKSWLHNKKPGILFSFEMPASQLGRRCLGITKHMNTDLLNKGRVSTFYMKEVGKHISQLEGLHAEVPLLIVQGSMDTSLAFVEDLVWEHKPEWVGVDAAYLMRARKGRGSISRTDNIADGAEGLKQVAMLTGCSMMATYQYNRKGAGSLDNIMYSDTIGQVASLVFDIQDDKKKSAKWHGVSSRILSIIKGRDGEQGSVRVIFDAARSRIQQAEVLFNKDTGLSTHQIAMMQEAYAEYLDSSGTTIDMSYAQVSDSFSFQPTRGDMH